MKYSKFLILLIIPLIITCNPKTNEETDDEEYNDTLINYNFNSVEFNSDSAYSYVQKQVDFGPRVPNTKAHVNCGDWLGNMLKKWCDTVYIQNFQVKNFKNVFLNGKNIIGSINPNAKKRLLLCAHWDTRPQADQDSFNPQLPADGANDGGSGIGVLLEIARQMKIKRPETGIDIIFFDLEDGGSNEEKEVEGTWCLGSQHWAKNTHIPDYRALNGILLDMVGAPNATFAREGLSVKFDNNFLGIIWESAASMGFGNYFINYSKDGITDDHVYVSFLAKIPTIDIIEYDPRTSSGFGRYWHTHKDNMSVIDKNTLLAVGKTVMYVSYNFLKLTDYK